MDEQRVLPPFDVMIRELDVVPENNASCHGQARGQTNADDGPEVEAIPFRRPRVAVGASKSGQAHAKMSGAHVVRLHADACLASLYDASLTPALAPADTKENVQAWHGLCAMSSP